MYKKYCFLLFLPLLACTQPERPNKKVELLNTNKKRVDASEFKNLSLAQAKSANGEPSEERKYRLSDEITEFNVHLLNFFTEEEIALLEVVECTWKYDEENNLTVWYNSKNTEKPITLELWNMNNEY